MGNKLFGVNISGLVHASMSKGLLAATLVKQTAGARDANSPTAGKTIDENSYPCRGFTEDYDVAQVNGTTILMTDRKVMLIGDSIQGGAVKPEANDKVTIEGATYTIIRVKRDPAAATYTCQVRA